jgi:hypothetical protein
VAIARPLSDLPRFIRLIEDAAAPAAAEAANAAALVLVTSVRNAMPTRRLNAPATLKGKRTGRAINWGYKQASSERQKRRPTALLVGRGPVHLLEVPIGKHGILQGYVRRDGRIVDRVSPRKGEAALNRRRRNAGPTLAQVGTTVSAHVVPHSGVKRLIGSGPFYRGLRSADGPAQRRMTTVMKAKILGGTKGF